MSTKTRILIVDDDEPVRRVLSELFSILGYAPVAVNNGREALEAFGQSPFGLVITDFDMPILDGSRLAYFIKERSPHTPVLMITGNTEEEVKSGSVDAYMVKPFSLAELEKAVHRLLPARSIPRRRTLPLA